MRAKELIDNLKAAFDNAGSASTLTNLADIHLMYMLDEARAKLASQKMDGFVNVDLMSQHVDAELQNTDEFEEAYVDLNVSLIEIPKPIAYLNGSGIFSVGPIDGSTSYSHISYAELRTALARKYTGSSPKWFWFKDKIYLVNVFSIGAEQVRVRGIFDEPWRVIKANGLFKRLKPYDFEYPLSLKDADTVYKLAQQGDMAWADDAITAVNKSKSRSTDTAKMLEALKGLGGTQ